MRKLHVIGFSADHGAFILATKRGAKSGGYLLALDESLIREWERARAEAPEAELPAPRPRSGTGSALTPREIQSRLRSGRSLEEVASEAGVGVEWVERFAAPVLAEQAAAVQRAGLAVLHTPRRGPSDRPLEASVRRNLAERGVSMGEDDWQEAWSARHLVDTDWLVSFAFRNRGRLLTAEWLLNLANGALTPRNRLATELGFIEPGRRAVAGADGAQIPSPPSLPQPGRKAPKRVAARRPVASKAAATTGGPKTTARSPAAKKPVARKASAQKAPAAKVAAGKSAGKAGPAKAPAAGVGTAKASAGKAAAAKVAAAKEPPGGKVSAKAPPGAKVAAAKVAAAKEPPGGKVSAKAPPGAKVPGPPAVGPGRKVAFESMEAERRDRSRRVAPTAGSPPADHVQTDANASPPLGAHFARAAGRSAPVVAVPGTANGNGGPRPDRPLRANRVGPRPPAEPPPSLFDTDDLSPGSPNFRPGEQD